MSSLKNEIIGSWKLLSYIEVPIEGEESLFPMGKVPNGILIFSPDGYMSVQISDTDATPYAIEDRFNASDADLLKRVKGYIAFSGRYSVDNLLGSVVYHIDVSLYPNWEGAKQVRKLDFEGDVLYQRSLEPIHSGGQLVHAYMTWQKLHKATIEVIEQVDKNDINS